MKWYESEFAVKVGEGLGIFLICLGIGTCSMLSYNTKIGVTKPAVEKVEKSINDRVD